jgi:hypothetical protein
LPVATAIAQESGGSGAGRVLHRREALGLEEDRSAESDSQDQLFAENRHPVWIWGHRHRRVKSKLHTRGCVFDRPANEYHNKRFVPW